jgi:predicted transcriptional regulator
MVPQIAILLALMRHNNVTLQQLFELVKKEIDYSTSYMSAEELARDLNVLRLLGLIEEKDGRYSLTEKGKLVLEKITSVKEKERYMNV